MFVTTQPWQRDEDYANLIQDLKPPPPPGDESVWELHFCKWWGWNWVRKNAVEVPMQKRIEAPLQNPVQQPPPPSNRPVDQKKTKIKLEKPAVKPEKKPIKNLCRTLCFKNVKKQKPLQKMYNTPSNSVIEGCDTKMEKPVTTHQNTYNPPNATVEEENSNSTVQKEIEELVTKETKNEVYTYPESRSHRKKKMRKEWSTSSSDECSCCNCAGSGSSIEGSVEYINITCCPCCHPREPPVPPKKHTSENYTQPTLPRSKMMATQTEEKEKKRRRRRICVVCCSCGQNNVPPCCLCDKIGKEEEKTEKKRYKHRSLEAEPETGSINEPTFYKTDAPKKNRGRPNMYSAAYTVTTEHSSPLGKKPVEPIPVVKKKFEPRYKTAMPLDMALFYDYNKPITKFGIPSQYSWIHATKSDIWDQLSHLRVSHEFSSPVSGNTYSISPVKVDSVGTTPSVLLNPLSVEEEVQSLKKIESEVKMDLKSRIMLDAVCDAILSKDKELSRNSSIFMNELTYPSSITQTESIINNLYKSEKKPTNTTSSKLNQTTLDEIIFEDVKRLNESRSVNKKNTSELNLNSICHGNRSFSEFARVRSPRTYSIENPFRRVTPNPSFSLNYSSHQNNSRTSRENRTPCKLTDYVIKKDQSLGPMMGQATFSRTGLMSASKRSASPTPGQNIKKAKLREPVSLSSFDNKNITDIFKKIDEIVLRSKVNNEEIQSVLNAIPKRTFQFFTSWEVSNVANQNPPLQIRERERASTSSMNTVIEEQEDRDQNSKIKTAHVKKKKAVNRPSLIPKRVTDAKLNKK